MPYLLSLYLYLLAGAAGHHHHRQACASFNDFNKNISLSALLINSFRLKITFFPLRSLLLINFFFLLLICSLLCIKITARDRSERPSSAAPGECISQSPSSIHRSVSGFVLGFGFGFGYGFGILSSGGKTSCRWCECLWNFYGLPFLFVFGFFSFCFGFFGLVLGAFVLVCLCLKRTLCAIALAAHLFIIRSPADFPCVPLVLTLWLCLVWLWLWQLNIQKYTYSCE